MSQETLENPTNRPVPRNAILIADPDQGPVESPPEAPLAPVVVTSLKDFQRTITATDFKFLAAFIDPELGNPAWLSIARDIHARYPGIPLFLLCEKAPPMSAEDLRQLGVHKHLLKPVTFAQMTAELAAPVEPPTASAPAESHTATEAEVTYVALKAASLVANMALNFDIYIKLGPDHYTRLWSAGDMVDKEQFQRQVHAGVSDYYIRKTDHAAFLKKYDELVNTMLDNPQTPFSVKISEIRSAGENTINLLKRQGVRAENIHHAVNYANTAMKAVGTLARSHADLRKLFLDITVMEHAVSATMLGSLILFNIGMPEGDLFNQLGLALLLHDIALWDQSEAVQDEEPALMNSDDLSKFFAHPAESAWILSKVKDFPEAFIEAISEHHVRLDGSGFPVKKAPFKPNRIAELIGISGDLAQMLKRRGPDNRIDVLGKMRDSAPASYSPPIVEAFEKAFLK